MKDKLKKLISNFEFLIKKLTDFFIVLIEKIAFCFWNGESFILNFLQTIFLQIQESVKFCVNLVIYYIKYFKNILIYHSFAIIDYCLEKYEQLKQNFIYPFLLKINEIYNKIKDFIIYSGKKTLNTIKSIWIFFKDKVLIKLKVIIVNYCCSTLKLFLLLWNGIKKLFLKVKQLFYKIRAQFAKIFEKLYIIMQNILQIIKILAKKMYYQTNYLCNKIYNIAKYCIFKIMTFIIFVQHQINLGVQMFKGFMLYLFKLILKLIKQIVELQCKIILKFILALEILSPIFCLIDQILDMVYFIFSEPILLFNKIIEQGIDLFIYTILNKFYIGIKLLSEKLIQFLLKLERFIGIIIKQAKKITKIIYQKLINPIVKIVICYYKVIMKALKFIVQELKNLKDMIKYNYILPIRASIRLFGVKIKESLIKITQYVIQIMKYGVNQLKLALIFLKDQISAIKKSIANLINQFLQITKRVIFQQIKFVYGILIDSLKQFKQQIILMFKSLKKMIYNFNQAFREITVAQYKIILSQFKIILAQLKLIKETIKSLFKEYKNQVKQSMIEQLKAIKIIIKDLYHQQKQSLIQLKMQMIQQKAQIKQFVIQQKQATANQLRIIKQNIKMQSIQVKDSIVILKNDLKYSFVTMFKRN
ncbi:unnamed protein product [Paramecium sonneborni]|uniref:Transmembrane protein n=1 Tax=Paramecium sonneborni TaxID=65129 RepID=A0A8S1RK17_9CILI|nr:unnamed protein product [Paramecium sonneborni]